MKYIKNRRVEFFGTPVFCKNIMLLPAAKALQTAVHKAGNFVFVFFGVNNRAQSVSRIGKGDTGDVPGAGGTDFPAHLTGDKAVVLADSGSKIYV